MKSQRRFTEVSVALSFVILTAQIVANPVGEVVRAGSARVDRSAPGSLIIHQNSDRLVINWRDFSIAQGELTKFIQPSASSIALNRVVGSHPSKIFGNLEANGKIYLINPNGILVGRGGAVNTRGFVATTLDVSDASFMSRAKLSLSGDSSASVVNEGNIEAIGGDVFLVARTVENSGTIRAASGTVGLAAGNEVVIVPRGKERISVIAGNGNGSQSEKGVNNAGTIEAVSAELKAAGGNIYALAVNNGGIVRATGVRREGGRVILSADGGSVENAGIISAHNSDGSGGSVVLAGGHNAENPSTAINSGVIDARGEAEGSTGGEVRLTGDYVGLFGASVIDVSGAAGGGTALIGGDYQGANSRIQNAQRTFVDDEASVLADALAQGNGGKVVVWSDEVTRFSGSISARGGANGGNGGFVEVSGKQFLAFNGQADLRAPLGLAGSILLDPQDVTIQDSGADDALLGDSTLAFAEPDTATDVTISDDVLEALTGNILVQAHRDLFINEALTLANQTSGETVAFVAGGDLDINAAVTTGGASLSFTASDAGGANSVTATLTIDANVGDASTGPISFINDGSGGIAVNAAVVTGDVSIPDVGANSDESATSGGITLNSGGTITVAVSGSLTTGSAEVTGPAASGDDAATSGNVTITSGGAFVLNGTIVTGDATVGEDNGNDTATTGNIAIIAGTSITGSGSATTGDALYTTGAGAGQNEANSGSIALTAGNGAVSGGIGLSGLAALTIGSATGSNTADPGNNDEANAGSITLTSLDEINNGTASTALSLGALGAASGSTINTPGALVVTTTGAGGNVFLTSASDLSVGIVTTAGASAQTVSIGTSGGAALTINDVAEVLAGDNVTLDSGTGTLTLADTDFDVAAGNLTLRGNEINLTGGNNSVKGTGALVVEAGTAAQNIELAGAGGTGALDLTATDLNALEDGFSAITIGRSADGTGILTVAGATTLNDDVTLVAGSLVLNNSVTSSGNNVTLTARTGNITDGNAATANVIAAALTATAQTGIDLDTTITTLANADVAGAGNINISDTAGGLAVTTATTANGDIALNATGGDLAVTTATATGTGADVTLSTTTSGDVVVSAVTATGDAVSITSAGAVTDGNGAAVNVVSDTLTVVAQSGIDLDTTITTLINASLTAAGNINVANSAPLIVTAASTFDGDIAFTADAGDLTVTSATAGGAGGDINLTTTTSGDVNVGSLTANNDSVTITSVGAVTDANGAAANVIATDLTVLSQTGIDLDTTITTLINADVAGAGNINISDTAGGLAVTTATTANGDITLNATGGDLAVTTATATGTGADVALSTTTSGDVAVNAVTAAGDAVSITSAGAVTDGNGAAVNVVSDTLTVVAQSGIDLDTTIATLINASLAAAGNINVANSAPLIVTATTAANGNIDITSAGALTVASAVTTAGGDITLGATGGNLDVTTATAGGSGDIDLTTTTSGDVNVGSLTASGDSVSITSAGAVTDANGAAANVTATDLTVLSQTGIDLDTTITTLVNADVAGIGNIDVSDTTGGLTVTAATTADGDISLSADSGTLTVTAATATGTGADVTLNTTTSGNVALGAVTAAGDAVSITSAGAVTDGNGAAVNVVSDALTVVAQSGIDLDTTITTLINASLAAAGNINVADSDGLIVTATTAANGNIDITAAGALTVASAVTTAGGDITLGATGGNLDVTTATAGGSGDIQLTTTTSGDVNVGSATATGDDVTVNSAGAINELGVADGAADITGGTVSLTAATSIGGAGTEVETDAVTLNATATAGGVFVREDNAVTLGTIVAGTLVDIANLTADLTVGSVTAPGNITLAAQSGSVLDDGTAANITSTAGITAVTSTGGDIGTTAAPLDIESPGGAVNLTASSGGVHVNTVSAGDVQFQTSVSGAPVQTTFTQGGQTYTLQYSDDLTVSANGNINGIGGVTLQAPGILALDAVGSIGGAITAPLLINAGTVNLNAGTGISISEANDITVGAVSTASGPLFLEAAGSFTLNAGTDVDAGAGTAILVANGLPGIIVSGSPNFDSRFLIYALNASLTSPIVINNTANQPTIGALVADKLDSPRAFNAANPDPFGDTDSYFVFSLQANPPTDPSLFIDIPVEVFQPVSIVFGDYDPTKFGEVGDLWMSSSELYEIERKAGKAPKVVPPQVGRAKYVPQGN